MALERELETYNRLHDELVQHEGKYALIAEDHLIGVYDTHSDALNAGYAARGLQPFLVKKVSAIEVVAYFSRDLRAPCTALSA
jgi:hypothetical protein